MASNIPPLPEGFTLDAPSDTDVGATVLAKAREQYPYIKNADLAVVHSGGQKDGRKLEYWPSGEPGNEQSPRPAEISLEKAGIQIFGDDVKPSDVVADYVSHEAVKTDPVLKALYEDFAASVPENTMRARYAEHRKQFGEKRSYERWKESTGMPEFFRGYTFDQWPNASKYYSPEQLKKLDAVKSYLNTDASAKSDVIPPLPEGFVLDSAEQSQPESPPRSTAQEIGRQGALAGRAVLEGLGDLAAIPANALAGLGNLLLELDRRIAGNPDRAVIPDQSRGVTAVLDTAGVAAPETDTERLVNTIGRRATGATATIGTGTALQGAQGVTSTVGQTMASNPVIQAVGSATGPAAAEIARQAGAGKVGQTVADLAGSMAPAVIASGAQATTRGGFRWGEEGRKTVEKNIETFRRVGTTPTVGQATENRVTRGAESLLSRTPGGAGPLIQKAERQADELANSIEQRASQLVRKTSAEQAGRQIQRSISGEGGFVDKFKVQQTKLYDKLDDFIPASQRISVDKTQAALKDLNQNIEGAENVSKFFQNAKMKGIESALNKDIEARPELDDAAADILEAIRKVDPVKADQFGAELFRDGKLPYEAVKKLRTLVGREMADAGLASDVPRSKWKALYAALSQDLGQSVEGNPAAKAAWTRANNYTRAGMRRIEAIESVIDKNGGPEAVFRAATSGTKEGATTLRSVMQSVDAEGKKMISATVLRRLGIAKAGVQGELGDKFSTESFLTNWNLLSPEAKRTLFDRYGPTFRSDMDQVAKVAANLREGSQVFRNPSGTGQATAQAATVGGLAGAIITGHLGTAAGIGAGVTGANLTSRLMRNPNFVRWLARSTKFPVGAYAGQVNALLQQGKQTGDEDLVQAALFLKESQPNKSQQDERRQQGQ